MQNPSKEEGDDAGSGTGTRAVAGWRGIWDYFLGRGTRPSRKSRGTDNELARDDASGRSVWPHPMPVIAFCIDGAIHIVAGEGTRKARNLAADGRCVSATSSTTLPSLDIVVEGRANPLSDGDAVRHIAEVLSASGWPLEANGDKVYGPNAPTAGPPPYMIFRIVPSKGVRPPRHLRDGSVRSGRSAATDPLGLRNG